MKLIVRQLSGLGNQLFQYAAGRYYARQLNAEMELAIDPATRAVAHGHPRPFLLAHFSIGASYHELTPFERLVAFTDHPRLGSMKTLAGAALQTGLRTQVVSENVNQRFCFQPAISVRRGVRTVYLLGYWQVQHIAESISDDLRKEFAFREPPTGRNLDLIRRIQGSVNPVSVHIRRGDYTLAAEGNIALPVEYYTGAIATAKAQLDNPTFFIFSDDIDFARSSIGRDLSAVFVDNNDSLTAHEDLRLMAACRHHIIANSTFSWWGAWLSQGAGKIVFAPRNWRVGGRPRYDDLFPTGWQLLG